MISIKIKRTQYAMGFPTIVGKIDQPDTRAELNSQIATYRKRSRLR